MTKYLFTADDFERLAEAGILGPEDRVELIEGKIVRMTPISSRHAGIVNRLARILMERTAARAVVAVQNPLRLGKHSEPQPDLAVLRPQSDDYCGRHPLPPDVLLVVEVADASVGYDREVKLPLYARAGIPEVWLVDIPGRCMDVHRRPQGEAYEEVQRIGCEDPGAELTPDRLPGVRIPVGEVLALLR